MNQITPYRVLTPRLMLRCWDPGDAPALAGLVARNLEHLRPWMNWASEENAQPEIQYQRLRQARARFDQDLDFIYGVLSRDGQTLLGSTGLHTRVGEGVLEIGYWIDKDHTRQGLATELSAALTKTAFEIFKVKRIEIHCDPENLASAAVPRKLGYTLEAVLRQRTVDYDGKPSDSMIWTLLESEYPTSPGALIAIEAFDAAGREIPFQFQA
jgi:RimJ/RimL family protein N-acetyltransferase